MSYKSYAQGGQYGTYHIDIPIKEEINEDLRAAGNFAKQMERSQKYREKWANSYLSALNKKSDIERQNRDDNFEFAQNNFKRIYEGEQREFEGRMAELKREHAEEANKAAEPGFMEQLMPLLMQLAPMAIDTINQMQAANTEAAIKEKTITGQKLIQHFREQNIAGRNLITVQQEIGVLGGVERRAALTKLAKETLIPQETLGRYFLGDGTHTFAAQSLSAQRVGERTRLAIQASVDGQTVKGVRPLSINNGGFSSQQEQNNAINTELFRLQSEALGGEDEYWKLGEHVRAELDKGNGSFKRRLTSQETSEWGKKWDGVNKTVFDRDVSRANNSGTLPQLLKDYTAVGVNQNIEPAIARVQGLNKIAGIYTLEAGYTADGWLQFGQQIAAERGLPGIPKTKDAPGSFWQVYNAKLNELRKGEVKIRRQLQQNQTAESKQVIETGKQFMLNNPISASSKYWQQWKNSYEFQNLNAETQKYINKMASDPQAIRAFINTSQSFEAKSGLTETHQKSVVVQNLAGDLAIGAAGKDWENNNLTLINKTMSYAKIKYREILAENPGLDRSVAYERAVVEAWTEMTGPKGNVKFINRSADGTPTDPAKPISTNYSTGADIYKKEVNSKTNFTDRIKPLILSGSNEYFEWPSMNTSNTLASVNTTNTLYQQRNPGMDITPQEVRDVIYSPWIQTIAAEHRKAGIPKSGSQILNEQGEAWAKKTGQKWTPIDYVTQEDLGKASARARRDLEQTFNFSGSEQVNRAHLNYQKGEPYQLNKFVPAAAFGTSSPYGPRVHPFTNEVSDHSANDHLVPDRTPTTTLVPNGTVTDVKMDNGAAGHEYTVSYNYGGHTVEVRSLHNDEIHVQPGQVVNPGDIIGLSGSTGRSTGPHTHNEYYVDGQLVNGATFKINGKPIQEIFLGYAR